MKKNKIKKPSMSSYYASINKSFELDECSIINISINILMSFNNVEIM